MALWLSGALFLICCATMNARAADAEFCPLAQMSAHCDVAADGDDLPRLSKPSQADLMECCGFMPAVFDKTRKLEQSQNVVVLPDVLVAQIVVEVPVIDSLSLRTGYHSPLADQQGIFISNCVYRI